MMRFYSLSYTETMDLPFPAFFALFGKIEALRAEETVAQIDAATHVAALGNGVDSDLRERLTEIHDKYVVSECGDRGRGKLEPDPNALQMLQAFAGQAKDLADRQNKLKKSLRGEK